MADVDEFDLAEARAQMEPPPPRRRARRGPWLWVACAVMLLVLGVGAAPEHPLPIGAGTEQGEAYGTLDVDLISPPEVAWSTPLDGVETAGWPLLQRLGDVVIVTSDPMIGLDMATGEQRWTLAAAPGACSITMRVTCLDSSHEGVVMSLDPATGQIENTQVPAAAAHAFAVEGGVVVAVDIDDGRLVKIDGTGVTSWDVPLDAAVIDSEDPYPWLMAGIVGDLLVVGGPVSYAVDIRTGEVQPHPGQWSIWTSPLGLSVEYISDSPIRYLIDSDGRTMTLPANAAPLRVDDGTGADILLQMDGEHLNASFGDGVELWTVPSEHDVADDRHVTFPMARLDGVVVAGGYGDAVVISGHDQITGAELWRLPDGSWPEILAGAGSTMLWLSNSTSLAARDTRSGADLWEQDLGDVLGTVATADGIIVLTASALTRLAWPGSSS